MPAIVAPKDNYGFVELAEPFKLVQNLPDLGVGETDACPVAVDAFSLFCFTEEREIVLSIVSQVGIGAVDFLFAVVQKVAQI